MSDRRGDHFSFGDFRLDARRRLLFARATGEVVPLPAKAFDALLHLLAHAGEIMPKADLMKAVWPHVVVEENSLSQCISALRKALGEDPAEHRYIVTAPGRGYRFIAAVTRDSGLSRGPADEEHSVDGQALAVLPFKPMGDPGAHGSLGIGMADAVIMRLGQLPGIELRPLSSVRRFSDPDQDPIEAGHALGVDTVLDGWVQRDADRLRISVRLLAAPSGRQLWADRFDESFTDIFSIQDAIAERVAAAVLPSLTGGDRRKLRAHPTDDAEAYQHYVTGWLGLTRPGQGAIELAIEHLERAVARDPEFALAHACLGDAYALLGVFNLAAPHDVFPKARAATERALALAPNLDEAHAEQAHIHWIYDLDFPAAERSCARALEIDPRSVMGLHYMGLLMISYGRFDEALDFIRRAQACEPLAPNLNSNIGLIHYYAGRHAQAKRQFEATLELDPHFDHARSFLGRTLMRMGDIDGAIVEFERRSGFTLGFDADLPSAYALRGETARARAELDRLKAERAQRHVSAYDIASIHAALDDRDDAIAWLKIAVDQRIQLICFVKVDPAFADVREEPEFKDILMRLGVSP
jgi:serine/threonine-protein kinase